MPPGAIQPGGSTTDTNLDWGIMWSGWDGAGGSATEVFDPTVSSTNSIPGSIHVTIFLYGNAASNAPAGAANIAVGDFITPGIGYNSNLNANETNAVDFSLYSALSFDILVNVKTSSNSPIPIALYDWNGDNVQIGSVPIPATNGWQHFSFPIGFMFSFNDSTAPPPNGTAWGFYNWYQTNPPACEDFWIDNVQLVGEPAFPPPTLTPPVKTIPGLSAFASTEENSIWDEQMVMLVASNGLSWVGRASAAKPVSYSFGINGFPTNSPPWTAEAFLFLAPNPSAEENSPDWIESNCVTVALYSSDTNGGGAMQFTYKVNEPENDLMYWSISPYTNTPGSWNGVTPNYFESGLLSTLTSAQLFGTWTVRFTSDTNGTLIAPDGTTNSFIFPPYNVSYFADATNTFNVYLGMSANISNAINQAVVFSSFAITNVPSACSDDFLADTSLNTNIWNSSYSAGPEGVLIAPSNAPYWVTWTLPARGFSLVDSASLGTGAVWSNVTTYAPIPMYYISKQLIATNDLTSTKAEFFALIKRTYTQLLVLLPGESNAPNTATGKTGTPTPVDLASANGQVTITVLAVDSHWNPVGGITDTIDITSSDTSGYVNGSNPAPLSNGSEQFSWSFVTVGPQTVTATDTTNTNIPPATSSRVQVLSQ
jgi:hypothetical protein